MSDEALRQIAKDVGALVKALGAGAAAFASALGANPAPAAPGGAGSKGGSIASDRDLDSERGNPEIKFDLKYGWDGASQIGRRMSECPPEFLDVLARSKDSSADKNEKNGKAKYAGYDRMDAARARGWAARLRAGWKPKTNGFGGGQPASDEDYGDGGTEDIPFVFDATIHGRWDRP